MPSNPRFRRPDVDPAIHPNPAPESSLVEELASTVDEMRQLATDFGLRPYRVLVVRVQWSGRRVGRGIAQVSSERELLPTPKVVEWSQSLGGEATPGGVIEVGRGRLEQISPRYTEDELREFFRPSRDDGEEVFVEVRVDGRDGATSRRRFAPRGVPYRKAFEWRMGLFKQDEDRRRDGSVDAPTSFPKLDNPLMTPE